MNSKRFRVWLYNDNYRLGRYFTPEDNYIDKAQTTSLVLNLAGNAEITVNQSTLVHDSQDIEIFEDDVVIFDGVKYF
jgi:hypothetical protein